MSPDQPGRPGSTALSEIPAGGATDGALDGAIRSIPTVTARYWAGARHAAGVDDEQRRAATVGELIDSVIDDRPGLEKVLAVCAVLVDGRARGPQDALSEGQVVEFLPPFAGG